MDYQSVIFNTFGGLGLFIFGMRMMSEGLQQVAGNRMRKILETVSANRVVACLTGAVVTTLIQSSSATTVMLVGFVNAGLMNLTQAIGIALGANVGTTMTAQLIAFNITDTALPAIALGVIFKLFSKTRKYREFGSVILGFGLLFFGMVVMKMGVAPLKSSDVFVHFFTRFDVNSLGGILLCVVTGAAVTMVLQSSSATVGLTMTLATQGLINFPTAVALVLGENIGTTITAELSSIGTDINARRTARAHTMFNVLGVAYMVALFPFFVQFVSWISKSLMGMPPADVMVNGEYPDVARYIANAHTLFNVVNAAFFLLFLKTLIKVADMLTFSKEKAPEQDLFRPQYLDPHFIEVPAVSLRQARQELIRMSKIAGDMMDNVINAVGDKSLKNLGQWRHKEQALDILQKEITNHLVKVSQGRISEEESREISSLMRMVNNVERIGDSVENIAELIEEMVENKIALSPEGLKDYRVVADKVLEFYSFLVNGLVRNETRVMEQARVMEEDIDLMREEMRANHLARLRMGVCTLDPGLIFTDMLNHFEKIGDYCYNICQSMAGVK